MKKPLLVPPPGHSRLAPLLGQQCPPDVQRPTWGWAFQIAKGFCSFKVSSSPAGQSAAFWSSRAAWVAQMPLSLPPPKWSTFLLWPLSMVTETGGERGEHEGIILDDLFPVPQEEQLVDSCSYHICASSKTTLHPWVHFRDKFHIFSFYPCFDLY